MLTPCPHAASTSPKFNAARALYGLAPYGSFAELSDDFSVVSVSFASSACCKGVGSATLQQITLPCPPALPTPFSPAHWQALQQLYGSVDTLDLWVGGLAESGAGAEFIGQTFHAIIKDQ